MGLVSRGVVSAVVGWMTGVGDRRWSWGTLERGGELLALHWSKLIGCSGDLSGFRGWWVDGEVGGQGDERGLRAGEKTMVLT